MSDNKPECNYTKTPLICLPRSLSSSVSKPNIKSCLVHQEIARQLQEKEKKKYERHLERKREKRLKAERLRLETELAKDTEDARLRQGNGELAGDSDLIWFAHLNEYFNVLQKKS